MITNFTNTKLESYYWLSYRSIIDITLLSTINNLSCHLGMKSVVNFGVPLDLLLTYLLKVDKSIVLLRINK